MVQRIAAIVSLSILSISIPGCGGTSAKAGLGDAISQYNAQHYAEAQQAATTVMKRSHTGEREDAAYLAGLSAYQLGQRDEAERRFLAAVSSSNAETTGRAKAMLGQVRLDQNRPREAAGYFTEAAQSLTGEDARQSAYHAGLAYRQVGDSAAASRWLAMAKQPASSSVASPAGSIGGSTVRVGTSGSGVAAAAASSVTGFTLQVGAFSEKRRAQRAAEDAQSIAKRDNLGPVRVLPRRDDRNQPLYLVQVGWFPSRTAAAEARTRLGKLEYIVAPAAVSARSGA